MARSTAHDPLCPTPTEPQAWPFLCPSCLFIKRIRQDERDRWQPRNPVTRHHASFCWCAECIDEAVGPA